MPKQGKLDLKRGRKARHKNLAHARPNVRSNVKHAPPHGAAAQSVARAAKNTVRMRKKKPQPLGTCDDQS
ncbi:MAG TPA: hypothetical protein DCO65_00895 [Spartobacteria bacterium]|nr:hypothetical protein [Spartobacteria bacterium]